MCAAAMRPFYPVTLDTCLPVQPRLLKQLTYRPTPLRIRPTEQRKFSDASDCLADAHILGYCSAHMQSPGRTTLRGMFHLRCSCFTVA